MQGSGRLGADPDPFLEEALLGKVVRGQKENGWWALPASRMTTAFHRLGNEPQAPLTAESSFNKKGQAPWPALPPHNHTS